MIVYIAGKMTGLPDKGRAAFAQAERKLINMGHTVLNPAWLGEGLPKKAYMPICLTMVQQAETVVLLDGWETSPGAMIEKLFAEYQEMPVFEFDEFVRRTTDARQRVVERLSKDMAHSSLSMEEIKIQECQIKIEQLTNKEFVVRLKPLIEKYSQGHFPYKSAVEYGRAYWMIVSGWNPDMVLEHFGGQSHGQ